MSCTSNGWETSRTFRSCFIVMLSTSIVLIGIQRQRRMQCIGFDVDIFSSASRCAFVRVEQRKSIPSYIIDCLCQHALEWFIEISHLDRIIPSVIELLLTMMCVGFLSLSIEHDVFVYAADDLMSMKMSKHSSLCETALCQMSRSCRKPIDSRLD